VARLRPKIPAVATDFLFSTKLQNVSLVYPASYKGKVKVHPITVREGPEGEQRYSSALSLTWALDGSGLLRHAVVSLSPERDLVSIL
jgi:hypothetical protein